MRYLTFDDKLELALLSSYSIPVALFLHIFVVNFVNISPAATLVILSLFFLPPIVEKTQTFNAYYAPITMNILTIMQNDRSTESSNDAACMEYVKSL